MPAHPLTNLPTLTLAITTHERPEALAAILKSLRSQSYAPSEVLIADDGSGAATTEVIAAFKSQSPYPVKYLRQEHQGFRVARLRNLAIAAASFDYLLLIDGDMLLHPEFIADHIKMACHGYYTQGLRVQLSSQRTTSLIKEPTKLPNFFDRNLGLRRLHTLHCATLQPLLRYIGNKLIAIKSCNQAFWREDLLKINGFNELIEGWGAEDKELCARLEHSGIRRQTLLGGGIAFHLHHPPAERIRRKENEAIFQLTVLNKILRCEQGVQAHIEALHVKITAQE